MAILKIARMGHPILATPARSVSDPKNPEIRRLVNDMIETMMDAKESKSPFNGRLNKIKSIEKRFMSPGTIGDFNSAITAAKID